MFSTVMGRSLRGYRDLEQIGQGGFGRVYRAYQPVINREVAIKAILPEHASQPDFIRRFETEAQLIARLEHPFIVPLYDYWRDPSGAYLVMRYFKVGSLSKALLDGRKYDLPEAVRLLEQIAEALHVAHRNQVIHLDIKPANILLDEDGNGYLTDFGIARYLNTADNAPLETSENQAEFTGSLAYAAPEQIRQAGVGPHTDIYSLGLVLYEILSGEHPYSGATASQMVINHLSVLVPRLPDVPERINLVVQQATAKDSIARYSDTLEMAADLRAAIQPGRGEDARRITPVITNPYKGLRPFAEADSMDFFGRDLLINRLVRRLREDDRHRRFLAVVGPSGSGKSSAVMAGLLPALRRGAVAGSERWFVAEMIPGNDPLASLAAALLAVASEPPSDLQTILARDENGFGEAVRLMLPDDQPLLLVIDQFEEVFTLCEDVARREHFLKSVAAAVNDPAGLLSVVLTLRADFYDRPLLVEGFADLMRRRTEVVIPLDPQELEQAITGPAARVGMEIDTDLIASLVSDVRGEAGALPLLQYTLTELFAHREDNRLTLQAYRLIGGVAGALARRAEALYQEMPANHQDAAHQIFLRLVALGEGTEDTRRRSALTELVNAIPDQTVLQAVLERFTNYRLITSDHDPQTREPTYEVTHEALIGQWVRLRTWLDESRDDIRQERRLASLADEWLKADRDVGLLLRGTPLAQYEEWTQQSSLVLSPIQRDYLAASLAERASAEAADRRNRRLLGALTVVMGVALIAAIGFLMFAINQQRRAEAAAVEAQNVALIAAAREAMAIEDYDTARTLAHALVERIPQEGRAQSLYSQAIYAPSTERIFTQQDSGVWSLVLSPDGSILISGEDDGDVTLWDTGTGEAIGSLGSYDEQIYSMALSPDANTLLVNTGSLVDVWDLEKSALQATLEHPSTDTFIESAAFSPDGSQAFSVDYLGIMIRWDLDTGEPIEQYETADGDGLWGVAISPDGRWALTGKSNGDAILWDLETGELASELQTDAVLTTVGLAFSPDSKTAYTVPIGNTLYEWDIESGRLINAITFSDLLSSNQFYLSADGQTGLVRMDDFFLVVLDLGGEQGARKLVGHGEFVRSAALHPDASTAYSGANDGTIRRWQLSYGAAIRHFVGHENWINELDVSPDGARVVSASYDKTARIWDIASGETLHILDRSSEVYAAAFSPDGQHILLGTYQGNITLWDAETGWLIRDFSDGHAAAVIDITFTNDGRMAASVSDDATVILWDVETGELIRRFEGHTDWITGIEVSPDNTQLLSASFDRTAKVWDMATGELIQEFVGHESTVASAIFSPDGRQVLTSSTDTTLRLWDIATGEVLRIFEGHTGGTLSIAFSKDGSRILSTASDQTAILWDTQSGEVLRIYEGHGDWVYDVGFLPDEKSFITSSLDGTLYLWRIDETLEDMFNWAEQNRYAVEPTCIQRETYGIEPLCEE